jgi:hypothetical protein
MRTFALLATIIALAAPAAALAAKPPHPTTPAATPASPTFSYILRGTLTAYTAANGSTNGSVTIAVKNAVSGGNHAAKALINKTFTLVVTPSTKVTLHNGAFAANDKGTVKFRGKKGVTDAGGLTATQVIDQGPAHT